MEFKDFTAGINDNDRRIDRIVRSFVPEISLSEIYSAIRKGLVKINHKKCKQENHVFCGDTISIAVFLLNKNSSDLNSSNNNINDLTLPPFPEIVFENENFLILDKPYDMTVHGQENSLDKIVLNYYNSYNKDSSLSFKPGPLHRIDKKTSGLIVFSKSLEGARWFTQNIQNHQIKKEYIALLQGDVKDQTWEDFITNNNDKKDGFFTVDAASSKSDENSKKAVSHVKVIQIGSYKKITVSLVKIEIETGRKHQIRAQSSLHKHPLAGDSAYGGKNLNLGKRDFYLHSYCLKIPKNDLGLPSQIKKSLPEDFSEILSHCEIKNSDV